MRGSQKNLGKEIRTRTVSKKREREKCISLLGLSNPPGHPPNPPNPAELDPPPSDPTSPAVERGSKFSNPTPHGSVVGFTFQNP